MPTFLRHRGRLLSPDLHCHPIHLNKIISISFIVLLCAAVTYLIITTLRKCYHRQCRRRHPPASDVTANKEQVLVCEAQLRAIPVHVYVGPPLPASSPGIGTEAESCPVCLAEYKAGEEVRVLPQCTHMFHRACVDRWLITRSSFCPICRDRVIHRAAEPTATSCRRNGNVGNSNVGGAAVLLPVYVVPSSHNSALM